MVSLRLFISVNIDSPEILSQLSKFQSLVKFKGIKLVNPSLFHFSLHFLGDTSTELIPQLKQIISSVDQPSLTVQLEKSGVFPSYNNIKVIWAGVSYGSMELNSLHHQLKQQLQDNKFQIDSKFTPHLTLARVKFLDAASKQKVQHALHEYKSHIFGSQEITKVHLMQSTLTPDGPIYQSIFSKDL